MSITTVSRGLQSCLEPQLVEPLTLRLTLTPQKPVFSQPMIIGVTPHVSDSHSENEETELNDYIKNSSSSTSDNVENKKSTSSGEFGAWSFIESLTKEETVTPPYVHPLHQRSLSTLTNKSLELCTESLGSESGSDIGDENDLYSSSSSESESRRSPIRRERSRFSQVMHKKAARRSFPPPLTSISGSDYVQVTPHREGGRLVIKAVKIVTTQTCFEAERGDGRLRLSFKKSYYDSFSSSEEDSTDSSDEEEKEEKRCLNENKLNGNVGVVEGEMAIVKYQRPCSWYKDCGQGNKRLLNWKPFLGVAI